jgi:hypothetical protein
MKGGKSIYVDAFKVAKELKQTFPEAFDVLQTFRVTFSDEGTDPEYSVGYSHPIIRYD